MRRRDQHLISVMLKNKIEAVERYLTHIESKVGIYLAGFVFSIILLLIASIYVTPALQCINHGEEYARLSMNPWDLQRASPLRMRILSPLIAYFLFLRGELFLFFPLLSGLLFLSVIYTTFRSQSLTSLQSLGMVSLMAFNTPILFTLHFQGYTDTLSYLLIFLCLIVKDNLLAAIFLALSLFNHESNLFAFPYIVFSRCLRFTDKKQTILLFIMAMIPYVIYRYYIIQYAPVLYSTGYYLNAAQIRHNLLVIAKLLPIGIFEAFKLCWGIQIIAFVYLIKDKKYLEVCQIILFPVCAYLQLFIANDTSRLMGLAFPGILFSAKYLKDYWGPLFTKRLWIIIGLNFLIPTYYVGQEAMIPFFPLPVTIIIRYVFDIDLWTLWWK